MTLHCSEGKRRKFTTLSKAFKAFLDLSLSLSSMYVSYDIHQVYTWKHANSLSFSGGNRLHLGRQISTLG